MKAMEIDDKTINKTHCDLIIKQAMDLKNLFSSDLENITNQNKIDALSDIVAIKNSLSELRLFIESL